MPAAPTARSILTAWTPATIPRPRSRFKSWTLAHAKAMKNGAVATPTCSTLISALELSHAWLPRWGCGWPALARGDAPAPCETQVAAAAAAGQGHHRPGLETRALRGHQRHRLPPGLAGAAAGHRWVADGKCRYSLLSSKAAACWHAVDGASRDIFHGGVIGVGWRKTVRAGLHSLLVLCAGCAS